jgi:protein-L-isoaspartate(D-aspartate) O-methyltransferase
MELDTALDAARRAFAEEIRAVAHLGNAALVEAFARVPREAFLGPGPWHIARVLDRARPYRTTDDARPEQVYHDVVVAIDVDRQLNNGQPSALACWIEAAAPRLGEAVLHVGCGTGYYSAILAELVGPTGHVVACDIDPTLAGRARAALAPWPQARVAEGDELDASGGPGSQGGRYDVIFVNAGATHPRPEWLAALAPGGRLLLPLTAHVPQVLRHGVGMVVCAERRGDRWPARVVSPVGIYDCVGARDDAAEAQVRALLPSVGSRIHALSVEPHDRGPACLVHVAGSCLQE